MQILIIVFMWLITSERHLETPCLVLFSFFSLPLTSFPMFEKIVAFFFKRVQLKYQTTISEGILDHSKVCLFNNSIIYWLYVVNFINKKILALLNLVATEAYVQNTVFTVCLSATNFEGKDPIVKMLYLGF